MIKVDPIIAVKNVKDSSKWYQAVFNCKSAHGGDDFDVLKTKNDEVLICLHKWGEHDHPTLNNPDIPSRNGLILYFRTDNMYKIHQNIKEINSTIEKDIYLNPNSGLKEFSLIDPDGYYLTITELHEF